MPVKKDKKYLKRLIDGSLDAWRIDADRKPLLLRGARQVGKSSAVNELAKKFKYFIEINFEEMPQAHQLFAGNLNPNELCENISIYFKTPIIAGETLLFFDEIQACNPALSSLRFFYEKMPDLHVVAAGSLLEFALEEIPSFGVGRIRSIFMYPFSFDEFLIALGEESLLELKQKANCQKPLPELFHAKLISYLKKFMIMGGMPEVVAKYVESQKINEIQAVLDDLVISFKADFVKYKKKVSSHRISEVFDSVAQQAGGKFVFTKAATQSNLKQIKEAVDLLIKAGLVIPVTHSSANGIPLGAESDIKKRKLLLSDTGMFQRICGLNLSEVLITSDFSSINKGAIAEMFVGLEMLKYSNPYQQEELYYWHRETPSGNAEVDYVVQKNQTILPVEVKSSGKGSMQSLYQFLKEKNRQEGIRFSLENFSTFNNISVYPLYAVSNFKNS